MSECEERPIVANCAELGVHGVVEGTVRYEITPGAGANLVCQSVHLKYVGKNRDRVSYVATYLRRGVHDSTVSDPPTHLEELGLVLKRKLVG